MTCYFLRLTTNPDISVLCMCGVCVVYLSEIFLGDRSCGIEGEI